MFYQPYQPYQAEGTSSFVIIAVLIVGIIAVIGGGSYYLVYKANNVDCQVSTTLSDWSKCTPDCNGQQTRSREILVPQKGNGAACDVGQEIKDCPTSICLTEANLPQTFISNANNNYLAASETVNTSHANDIVSCAQQCVNDPSCLSYLYYGDYQEPNCEQYDFVDPKNFTLNRTVFGGLVARIGYRAPNKIQTDLDLYRYYDRTDQSNFIRGTIALKESSLTNVSENQCADICSMDKDCNSYGYQTDLRICSIIHQKGVHDGQTIQPNYHIGDKRASPLSSHPEWTTLDDYNNPNRTDSIFDTSNQSLYYGSREIMTLNTDVQGCQTLCAVDPACRSYEIFNDNECHLLSTEGIHTNNKWTNGRSCGDKITL